MCVGGCGCGSEVVGGREDHKPNTVVGYIVTTPWYTQEHKPYPSL